MVAATAADSSARPHVAEPTMPMFAIAGTYRIVGASPDGDSIRFYPDRPDAFTAAGLRVRTNASGGAQLRLEAIDALETHYTPRTSSVRRHQPLALADEASASLLDLLGFTDVERDGRGTVVAATPVECRGHILTRFADVYGRAVAFAFPGDRPGDPVDTVFLDVAELRGSVNHALLASGLVYPTFYSKLFADLRDDLAGTAVTARGEKAGVWASDATLGGALVDSWDHLENQVVILPKLFRRLAEYLTLDETGDDDLSGFPAFLELSDDRVIVVPDGRVTGLDDLIVVRDGTVTLTVPPERLVFLEK
jgi:endonuclease YncB( thermonuclease family)